MQNKKPRSPFLSAAAVLLFSFTVFAGMVLFLQWYEALLILLVAVSAGRMMWSRLSVEKKRVMSENIFMIISGMTALVIVLFVVYLLVHIFFEGRTSLTFDFIFSTPTEGLTEGGIWPAIVGTALLVIIMSLAGVPVGTITAIYLTEYASERSVIARFIRFAVNTLAGVPAIVFGLFGLGFFIGTVGTSIDTWEFNRRASRMKEIFKSASAFSDDGRATVSEIRRILEDGGNEYWDNELEQTRVLDEMHRVDEEMEMNEVLKFFSDRKRPHWGQPALIWAALTMALLTLPVVIVSVEEAIKSVPKDLREASLALGATKWGTIRRVVIPGSITGILTGGILAVSRGAGEVAPILFTGAAYYLPDLPNSLSSQFMELGYHIYVLTTQSTNVEATKPLQYATTLVLLLLTFTLNFSAIFLRSRIRAKMTREAQ